MPINIARHTYREQRNPRLLPFDMFTNKNVVYEKTIDYSNYKVKKNSIQRRWTHRRSFLFIHMIGQWLLVILLTYVCYSFIQSNIKSNERFKYILLFSMRSFHLINSLQQRSPQYTRLILIDIGLEEITRLSSTLFVHLLQSRVAE